MNMDDCQTVDLILVGCVNKKSDGPHKAKDLYASPLWRNRKQYAEHHQRPWFILSAKHGLLSPDAWIEKYDQSLDSLPTYERRAWSQRVLEELEKAVPSLRGLTVETHAGKIYTDFGLAQGLSEMGTSVRRPLVNISGIGKQINWYKNHMMYCPINTKK